ncbi:hypothetical protein [Haloplanus sp.]|uniref:hypothetical protein n=1 Tax=Haloplanus sp. TaxID=1961696 RepID=UPI00260173AE|nr:hypothetical protein [Haloplanus sp.]
MQTRLVIAVGVTLCLVALAGCSQPAGSFSMDAVNDTELADNASTPITEEELELADPEGRNRGERVLGRAVRNESTTVTAPEPPHSANETVYRTGDRFYTLSYTTVDTTTGRQVTYRLDGNVTAAEADENGWTVADYDDLPPVDKAALHTPVSSFSRDTEENRSLPEGIEEERAYSPAELNRSATANGQYDAIRHEGTLIELDVVSREPRPLTVYRYQPHPVADGADSYAACLRDAYAFELSGLDSDTRAVVAEATNGTYRTENTSDTAFRSILDRFHDRTAVSATARSGSWLVRYDGNLYWTNLRYARFDEYHRTATTDPPATVCS